MDFDSVKALYGLNDPFVNAKRLRKGELRFKDGSVFVIYKGVRRKGERVPEIGSARTEQLLDEMQPYLMGIAIEMSKDGPQFGYAYPIKSVDDVEPAMAIKEYRKFQAIGRTPYR